MQRNGEDQQEQKRCSKRAKTADLDEEAAKVERDSCRVRRGEMLWTRGIFGGILSAQPDSDPLKYGQYKYSLQGTKDGKAVSVVLWESNEALWRGSFADGEDVDGFGRGLTIPEMEASGMFAPRAKVLVDVARREADASGIRLVERVATSAGTGASAGTPNHRTAAAAAAAAGTAPTAAPTPGAAAAGTVPTAAPTPGASVAAPAAVTPDGSVQVQNAANTLVAAFNDQQTELTNIKTVLEATKTDLEETKSKLEKTETDLEETKSKLEETETDLEETKSKLEETETDLEKTKTALRDALAQRYAPHGTEDAQVQNRALKAERDMLAEENENLKIRIQNISNMANMINDDV
jgi:hypothetical protein